MKKLLILVLWLILIIMTACSPSAQTAETIIDSKYEPSITTQENPTAHISTSTSIQTPGLSNAEIETSAVSQLDPITFLNHPEITLQTVDEDPHFIIETTQQPYLLLFPLTAELNGENPKYFYDTKIPIEILRLPDGLTLGASGKYTIQLIPTNGSAQFHQNVKVTLLPHLVGHERFLAIYILETGTTDSATGLYTPTHTYYKDAEESILAEATYFEGLRQLYPNKFINILSALYDIALYQETNGPMIGYHGYSFNKMAELPLGENIRYVKGEDELIGAGVCAVASLTNTAFYSLSDQLGVPWMDSPDALVKRRYSHRLAPNYVTGPIIQDNIDAAVYVGPDLISDLIWEMPYGAPDIYFEFSIAPLYNQIAFEETQPNGIGKPSDLEAFVTIAFTTKDPGNQSEFLLNLLTQYKDFRESEYTRNKETFEQGIVIGPLSWAETNLIEIAKQVYPLGAR
jgi:hypothetical protein